MDTRPTASAKGVVKDSRGRLVANPELVAWFREAWNAIPAGKEHNSKRRNLISNQSYHQAELAAYFAGLINNDLINTLCGAGWGDENNVDLGSFERI